MSLAFLAAAVSVPAPSAALGGSWWQTVGGLVAVFALLLLSLKLLGRFQRRSGAARASVLTVWHLGPRREIQVLHLDDEVHYVYRHDGAMVVLQREAHAEWQARNAAAGPDRGAPNRLGSWLSLSALRPSGSATPD
jgi:hypothetical protein